jgi:MFS family permease
MLNPARPFLIALRERNLRLLFGGLVTSQAGDWLYNLALLAFVYERTGSTAWVGITTAARILPEVVLGPIGGVLADRYDRRLVMIASDVLRAATMAALAVVAFTGAPAILAPLLAALCTAAGAAYPQCVVAVMPRLVGGADLAAANAARIAITSLCVIAGPALGAALLLLSSTAVVFAVNGATFLVGAAVVTALPREALRRPAGAVEEVHASIRADLAVGWRALREHPDALPLVGADVVSSAVYGALTVLFVLVGERLGLGAAGYGYLLSALGVGGVLSAGLAHRAASSHRPRRALVGAAAAIGVSLVALTLSGSLSVAVVLAAAIGAGLFATEVVADTTLQRSLDPAVFARAYGLAVPGSRLERSWHLPASP